MQNPMLSGLQSVTLACVGEEKAGQVCEAMAAELRRRLGVPVMIAEPEALPRNDARQPMANLGWLKIAVSGSPAAEIVLEWGSAANRAGTGQHRGTATIKTAGRQIGSPALIAELISATPFS